MMYIITIKTNGRIIMGIKDRSFISISDSFLVWYSVHILCIARVVSGSGHKQSHDVGEP